MSVNTDIKVMAVGCNWDGLLNWELALSQDKPHEEAG